MARSTKKWTRTIKESAVLAELKSMEDDPGYNTQSSYHSDGDRYPNNLISFAEMHLEHLRKFTNIDPMQYISNLKLMTRIQ